jgi:hypothetical protein
MSSKQDLRLAFWLGLNLRNIPVTPATALVVTSGTVGSVTVDERDYEELVRKEYFEFVSKNPFVKLSNVGLVPDTQSDKDRVRGEIVITNINRSGVKMRHLRFDLVCKVKMVLIVCTTFFHIR